jgi:hypothetical protein
VGIDVAITTQSIEGSSIASAADELTRTLG